MIGTITRKPSRKNWGFIVGDGDQVERFFHAGSVPEHEAVQFHQMECGDRVKFIPTMFKHRGEWKPRAANVTLFAKAGDFKPEVPPEDPDHPELSEVS